jgi:hypothetical protein
MDDGSDGGGGVGLGEGEVAAGIPGVHRVGTTIEVGMLGSRRAEEPREGVTRRESAGVRIQDARSKMIEAKVRVEGFAGVAIDVRGVTSGSEEIAECVVVVRVRDVSGGVVEEADVAMSILTVPMCGPGSLQQLVLGQQLMAPGVGSNDDRCRVAVIERLEFL